MPKEQTPLTAEIIPEVAPDALIARLEAMRAKGLTWGEIADRLGVTSHRLWRWRSQWWGESVGQPRGASRHEQADEGLDPNQLEKLRRLREAFARHGLTPAYIRACKRRLRNGSRPPKQDAPLNFPDMPGAEEEGQRRLRVAYAPRPY